MPGAFRPPRLARFENFELDVRAGELRRHGGIPLLHESKLFGSRVPNCRFVVAVQRTEHLRKQLWPIIHHRRVEIYVVIIGCE